MDIIQASAPTRGKRGVFWAKMVLLIGSLAFSFVLAELVLSAISPPLLGATRDAQGRSALGPHERYGHRYKANWTGIQSSVEFTVPLFTNVDGFPGPAIPEDDSDVVVLLGDSFTAGYGVRWEQSFAAVAEQQLHRAGNETRVRVLACPDWGQANQLQALQDLGVRRSVRQIGVVICAENDVFDNWNGVRKAGAGIDYVPQKSWATWWNVRELARHSALVGRGYLAWRTLSGGNRIDKLNELLGTTTPITQEHWNVTQRQLSAIQSWCQAKNLPLFAVLIPPKWEVSDAAFKAAVPSSAREQLDRFRMTNGYRKALANLEIPLVDLTAPLKQASAPAYFTIDAHFNALGHEIAGHAIADMIRQSRTSAVK